MSPAWPLVSIVIPSFNQARYIEQAILSVLEQTYVRTEIIVIDGCSNDGTQDVLDRYSADLAYWISEPDTGQSEALNKGYARASGELYGWLNSDDIYLPGAIEAMVEIFNSHPHAAVVSGDYLTINAAGSVIEREVTFPFSLRQFIYEGFHINAQAMFWRAAAHTVVGQFDEGLRRTMDYDFIARLGREIGEEAFFWTARPLGAFRRHEAQKTQAYDEEVAREQQLILNKLGVKSRESALGRAMWILYRVRRGIWYTRRMGGRWMLRRALSAARQAPWMQDR